MNILLIIILSSLSIHNISCANQLNSFLNLRKITNGVYNIILKERLVSLTFIGGLRSTREEYGSINLNFKILEYNYTNKNSSSNYFYIQHLNTKNYIGAKYNNNTNYPLAATDRIFNVSFLSLEWEFIKIDEISFAIKNKFGCYLKEARSKYICTTGVYSLFHLIKFYSEVTITKSDELILNEEPIDVVIKYIDLGDPNLIREGIHQIKKDADNEEL